MNILETSVYDKKYAVRADWECLPCSIEQLTSDGWKRTQYQVADFCHDAYSALQVVVADLLSIDGDAVDSKMVCDAIERAKWV